MTEKPPERAAVSWWVCIRTGVITYYLTSLVVLLGVLLGLDFFERAGPPLPPREIPISADPFLLATTHWDGRHYLEIVREGYSYDLQRRSNVAFFPLYPVLVAGVHRAAGLGVEWAGLLVAHVLLLAAFVLLAAYVQRRYFRDSPQSAAWAVLAFGLFPTTFFLRMSYSESTFLLLAVLAMFGIQRRWRPIVVAGIVGLATATRPVGVALLAPLWLYVWGRSESREAVSEPSGPHPQPLSRWRERGVLKRLGRITCLTPLALWGLLGYMVFQYAEFGEPLAFAKTFEYDARKRLLGLRQLVSRAEALRFGQSFLDDLLLARLHGEIRLGEGNFVLGWVAVLRDQIAGVSSERNVLDFSLGARAELDHFRDPKEMVSRVVSRVLASGYGLVDNLGEVLPTSVAQQELKIPGAPELRAGLRVGADHVLKAGVQSNDHFLVHRSPSPSWG